MVEEGLMKIKADLRGRTLSKEFQVIKEFYHKNKDLLIYFTQTLYKLQPVVEQLLISTICECEKVWTEEDVKKCIKKFESANFLKRQRKGYVSTNKLKNWLKQEGLTHTIFKT